MFDNSYIIKCTFIYHIVDEDSGDDLNGDHNVSSGDHDARIYHHSIQSIQNYDISLNNKLRSNNKCLTQYDSYTYHVINNTYLSEHLSHQPQQYHHHHHHSHHYQEDYYCMKLTMLLGHEHYDSYSEVLLDFSYNYPPNRRVILDNVTYCYPLINDATNNGTTNNNTSVIHSMLLKSDLLFDRYHMDDSITINNTFYNNKYKNNNNDQHERLNIDRIRWFTGLWYHHHHHHHTYDDWAKKSQGEFNLSSNPLYYHENHEYTDYHNEYIKYVSYGDNLASILYNRSYRKQPPPYYGSAWSNFYYHHGLSFSSTHSSLSSLKHFMKVEINRNLTAVSSGTRLTIPLINQLLPHQFGDNYFFKHVILTSTGQINHDNDTMHTNNNSYFRSNSSSSSSSSSSSNNSSSSSMISSSSSRSSSRSSRRSRSSSR